MPGKGYLTVSGLIFALVSLLHLVRIVRHVDVQFGSCSIPMWGSYIGFAVAAGLALWAYRTAKR